LAAGSALFAIPSLLVSVGLLLADRWLGTQFLDAKAGDPILHQHLFWFFGHPAVYMLILPIMGFFTSQLLPPEWKGRWPQSLALGCMGCIAVLGFAAWGHHMFQSGLDPRVSGRFSTATLLISWPSALLVGLWLLMALRTASLPQRPPGFWHGLAFLVLFSAGGLGGVLLATAPLNAHLHETYWVVGHIHLVLFGGSALGLAGALFLLSPELLPRPLTRGSMLAHLALTLPLLLFVFGMMHWMGFAGLGRRMYQVPALDLLNQVRAPNAAVAYGAFALLLGQGMLVLSLLEGLGVLPRNISRMMSLFLVVLSTTLMGLAWLTLLRAGWGWWLLPIFSPMSMGVALAVWNLLRLDVPLRPVPLGDPIPAP
jgi:cytochrome c oxidase subunit 1